MSAGLGPLDLGGHENPSGKPAPLYASKYLAEQLLSALCDDAGGPMPTWLWLAGSLTPESLAAINKTATEPSGGKEYSDLLFAFSEHNKNGTDLCATSGDENDDNHDGNRRYHVTTSALADGMV